MNGPSVRELGRVLDPDEKRWTGAIRRMAIAVTSRVLWQLVGYKIDTKTETLPAEVFSGIGFYARPPRNGKPEALAVFAAGTKSPAVVATRDEKTRAAMAKIDEDETAVFNSQSVTLIRKDGVIEARSKDGTAVALATKADIDALAAYIGGLTLKVTTTGTATNHTGYAGPPLATPLAPAPPLPGFSGQPPEASGTSVLKGE